MSYVVSTTVNLEDAPNHNIDKFLEFRVYTLIMNALQNIQLHCKYITTVFSTQEK